MPGVAVKWGKARPAFPHEAQKYGPPSQSKEGTLAVNNAASDDVMHDLNASEWEQQVLTIIDMIELGYLDAHLKRIAKAAYLRAAKIGQTPKTQGNAPKIEKEVNLDGSTQVKRDMSQGLPVKRLNAAGVARVENNGGTVLSIGKPGFDHAYDRADFIGQEFVIKPGMYRSDQYNGLVAKIIGAGEKTLKVTFPYAADGSKPSGPGGTKDVAFIPLSRVQHILSLEYK